MIMTPVKVSRNRDGEARLDEGIDLAVATSQRSGEARSHQRASREYFGLLIRSEDQRVFEVTGDDPAHLRRTPL